MDYIEHRNFYKLVVCRVVSKSFDHILRVWLIIPDHIK